MSTIFYMLRKEWKNRLLALFRHPGKLVVYILLVVLLVNSVISTALTPPGGPGRLFGSAHPARRLLGDFAVVHCAHPVECAAKGHHLLWHERRQPAVCVAHIPQKDPGIWPDEADGPHAVDDVLFPVLRGDDGADVRDCLDGHAWP